ncbi:MAG: hypothetical protein HFJ51_06625 [Clostridia bacterium]|nr:hypothetical protein [Clostridia bacterium]
MTIVKIIAFIVFALACAVIYHNTNSYEPAKRIGYILVRNDYNVLCHINSWKCCNKWYKC